MSDISHILISVMTTAARNVLNQALNLSNDERVEIYTELAKHLPEENLSPEEWEKVWKRELSKRVEEIESGEVKCIPYSEARERWNKILGRSETA